MKTNLTVPALIVMVVLMVAVITVKIDGKESTAAVVISCGLFNVIGAIVYPGNPEVTGKMLSMSEDRLALYHVDLISKFTGIFMCFIGYAALLTSMVFPKNTFALLVVAYFMLIFWFVFLTSYKKFKRSAMELWNDDLDYQVDDNPPNDKQ